MSNFQHNPAKPAVTELRVVRHAVPETVTVTLGIKEALLLSALQGRCSGDVHGVTLFEGLKLDPRWDEVYELLGHAIAYRTHPDCSQACTISLHHIQPQLDAALNK